MTLASTTDTGAAALGEGEADVFARLGSLEVRLARSDDEIRESQKLRYEVFYEEMAAQATPEMAATRIDADRFDPICDHLLTIDHSKPLGAQVVGTYRLLRQEVAEAHGGFYTAGEFDIAPLITRRGPGTRFLELGRSCVAKDYRTNNVIQMLWRGIAVYVSRHKIDVMIGCASLPGTNPDDHDLTLSFMAKVFAPPPEWYVRAHDKLYVEMRRMPFDKVDDRAALRRLPPLVKGYLRLGCYIGDGAVVDEQFGTTDVMIILPVPRISDRYFAHVGKENAGAAGEE